MEICEGKIIIKFSYIETVLIWKLLNAHSLNENELEQMKDMKIKFDCILYG